MIGPAVKVIIALLFTVEIIGKYEGIITYGVVM
jgi:hypothetical protein